MRARGRSEPGSTRQVGEVQASQALSSRLSGPLPIKRLDIRWADINDSGAVAAAFRGAEGVFVLVPSNFDPSPDLFEARATATTLKSALNAARPGRVVYLSTIGARRNRPRHAHSMRACSNHEGLRLHAQEIDAVAPRPPPATPL